MEPRQEKHDIDELLAIMDRLRDPEHGCPWDLKQTFRTIVPYTLEEAYEVADAIEHGDWDELPAELGDLLFQVVFYARLGKEAGRFDFADVVSGICRKMLRRHPHVFGDAEFVDDASLHHAWEQAKREERAAAGCVAAPSQLDGVTRALPALVRAEKLQRRAARVGFDWPDAGGAIAKTREEFEEIGQALAEGDRGELEAELGDLMFAMVNVTRLLGFDAEQTLRAANAKFERRFRRMEQLLAGDGPADLAALDLEALDAAWERVKELENLER
jgi:ATP diphosphatase